MFLDFRQLEAGKIIETDICIIGAGAAGITLAYSFIGSNIGVCLLESGGFEYNDPIQSLYEGEPLGVTSPHTLLGCRLRYFGGTTNHWVGMCTPLSKVDFEPRSWLPYSGWPIRKEDLDPYYEQAQRICELGPYRYDVEALTDESQPFPSFDATKVVPRFWQVSTPTRFGTNYRDALEDAQDIRVYLYANVTQLETNETASEVQSVKIRTLDGHTGSVRARYVVLACGAIENSRILLLSNGVENHGLGNSNGLVGRFFMVHPLSESSGNVLANDTRRLTPLLDAYMKEGVKVRAGLGLSKEAQQRYQILNYSGRIKVSWDRDTGYHNLQELARDMKRGNWPDEFGEKLWNVVKDLDSAAKGLYNKARGKPYRGEQITGIYVLSQSEQAPNPDSRVILSEQHDQLGLRKIKVDWRLCELDRRTIRKAIELIGEELGRLGLGRIKLADWLVERNSEWAKALRGSCHHMGTTRMADDPKRGVVDQNCRLHTVHNLYMAGSSVFPTTGYANPTLTIVALTLRLASHLKGLFAR